MQRRERTLVFWSTKGRKGCGGQAICITSTYRRLTCHGVRVMGAILLSLFILLNGGYYSSTWTSFPVFLFLPPLLFLSPYGLCTWSPVSSMDRDKLEETQQPAQMDMRSNVYIEWMRFPYATEGLVSDKYPRFAHSRLKEMSIARLGIPGRSMCTMKSNKIILISSNHRSYHMLDELLFD